MRWLQFALFVAGIAALAWHDRAASTASWYALLVAAIGLVTASAAELLRLRRSARRRQNARHRGLE